MDYYETELRNKNRGYMKLIVWQKAIQLFELAWKISFIESKIDFKLRSQFADATQSISSNIAEGYGRRSINEYIQFLYTALGSTAEALSRAIGLQRTKQISYARFNDFNLLHYDVDNRLLRLVEKLEQKRDAGDWVNRISEAPSAYLDDSELHHSFPPSLHPSERHA
ncbi:MAG: four helix bundle protein [Chthoniobacterales bacterium]